MYRSTKGASKARRDQINAEIRTLKELLPIAEVDKARLSYLHVMSLACMYTRKSVFFSQEMETASGQEESSRFMSFQELSRLVQELPGFLLMVTSEGKLLYLSDSVAEHLGHSMVDLVAQGDSVYDIIDPTDHFVMRSNLSPTTSPDTDRLFRCRFNTSKSARRQSAGSRLTLVRAHCLSTPGTAASYWTSNPAWLCFCSPLEGQPSSPGTPPTLSPPADHAFFLAGFHSRHSQDMRMQDADDSLSVYLGYDVEVLRSRSWYSLLHPQDLPHASAQHCSLLSEGGEGRAEMVVRVETQDHTFTWLYMVLHLETGENPISCRSYIISESEAWSVRQQLCTEQTQLALVLSASATYQDSLGLRSPDTLSSPDQVFTPSSSGLSGQSFDFSAAASTSMSSSEELGGAAAADPLLEGPRSSLSSLEEESFPQQGGQQQPPPPPESSDSAATPPAGTPPTSTATAINMDILTQNVFRRPSHMPHPPLTMHQQGRGFTCTPRYTPQLGRGGFTYREALFTYDSTPIPSAPPPPPPASRPLFLPLPAPYPAPCPTPYPASQQLLLSLEPCGGPTLYEKLPPTPDTPEEGDCSLMPLPLSLPPLYVDVPPRGSFCYPLEGLPTPEASPKGQAHPLGSQVQEEVELEQERAEISYLALQISSLAERFSSWCSSTPLPDAPPLEQDPIAPSGQSDLAKQLTCVVDPPHSLDESSLFEESMLQSLLLDLLSIFSPPSTPPHVPSYPSLSFQVPPTPPNPACWCSHVAVSTSHICSVQSTHCNGVVGGGATAGAETVDTEMESSSVPESLAAPATPITPAATPSLPRAQPLIGELVAMEPMFGAGASIAPVLGQQPELHQLHCDSPPKQLLPDGNGSDPSF